jgi:hypothetical protein
MEKALTKLVAATADAAKTKLFEDYTATAAGEWAPSE